FRFSPSRIPLAMGITMAGPINTMLAGLQSAVYGARIRRTKLAGPPLFILGHWRSGTTLLHELLFKDPSWGSPSTYQCFAPHHFLLTATLMRTLGAWLLPSKRPMDNMATGWDRPQEDEFALACLGLPSPYRRIAFPVAGMTTQPDLDYLNWDNIDAASQEQWIQTLQRFLQHVTAAQPVQDRRPLVVKSPTHTGRIHVLNRAFPDAKFIHISRDPMRLFPSTCRLWRTLDEDHGLQVHGNASAENIEGYVIECFRRMYGSYFQHRDSIPRDRLIEIRYEDLVRQPVQTLQDIYAQLQLGDFDSVRPALQQWADTEHRQYQTNQFDEQPKLRQRLMESWGDYFRHYDYVDGGN
ncbi:MAG: sulfotransferase, partial [Planctomycetota bacterium]